MPSLKVGLLLKFRKFHTFWETLFIAIIKLFQKILDNKNGTGTPIVARLATICNFDRTFIKFCLYKYMMPYTT